MTFDNEWPNLSQLPQDDALAVFLQHQDARNAKLG